MQAETRVVRATQVLAQRGPDKLILLNPDDGQYFTLDEVGSRVWELSDGSRTVGEITGVIGEEYDAPAETIGADVLDLLTELEREQLVIRVD